MKKIFTIALAFSLMLLMPGAIFAEENNEQEITSAGSENVELYAEVDSTYTVRLPQKVDVTNKTKTFDVDAYGNISSQKKVSVVFNTSAQLLDKNTSNNKREAISLTISNNSHDFTFDQLEDDYCDDVKFTVTVTHSEDIPAGSWSVNLPVVISLIAA